VAESLVFTEGAGRDVIYDEIMPQIEALVEGEADLTANLANIAAALKLAFEFFWVGFYFAKGDTLVLGPFQGPPACTRIGIGKGVCGYAFSMRETTIVADVDAFPGHIACASESRSEIVVPIFRTGEAAGVLDVDSARLDDFTNVDAEGLERVAQIVERLLALQAV